jgi:hypothetical protein
MKRSFQCAFGTAALLLSSSAWAQDFGAKGQLAISAERLFGFTHDSVTVDGATGKLDNFSFLSSPVVGGGLWGGFSGPRVAGDYFIIDHLSLGGAIGYSHWSAGNANANVAASGDSFTFAPRVGYSFAFNNIVGIWPRAGFTYKTYSAGNDSNHDLALTIEVPFVFTVIPHVAFWAGPTLDVGLSGSQSTTAGPLTRTVDLSATEFGIQTGLVGYVDL